MEQTQIEGLVFAMRVLVVVCILGLIVFAMLLISTRSSIQTAPTIDAIDGLYKRFKILWFRPSLFKEFQLSTLRRIAKSDYEKIDHLRTLNQKLEMFYKYKNSKVINQHKDIYPETAGLISKGVLAGIMDCMARENFVGTLGAAVSQFLKSGEAYPPSKEMYNKIQNFFELTHDDLNSQNMYAEFKRKYGGARQ